MAAVLTEQRLRERGTCSAAGCLRLCVYLFVSQGCGKQSN